MPDRQDDDPLMQMLIYGVPPDQKREKYGVELTPEEIENAERERVDHLQRSLDDPEPMSDEELWNRWMAAGVGTPEAVELARLVRERMA